MSARGLLVAVLRAASIAVGALAMLTFTSVLALGPDGLVAADGSSLRPWLLVDPVVRVVVAVAAFGLAPWIAARTFPSGTALTRPALVRTVAIVVALWATTWCLRSVAGWVGWETLGPGASFSGAGAEPTPRVMRLALYAAIATIAFLGGPRLRGARRRAATFLAHWFLPARPPGATQA